MVLAIVVYFPHLENPLHCDKLEATTISQRKHLQSLKERHTNAWIHSWKRYQSQDTEPSIAPRAPLDKTRLKTHSLLRKAESALITQTRTGGKGRADFLQKHRVPGITSPAYPCGWHRQRPEHMIMFCRFMRDRDSMFRDAGTKTYQVLTESPKPLRSLTA